MQIERTKKYFELLNDLKERIRQAKVTAAISVNFQLLSTYWSIGNTAKDLKEEFPDIKGFSIRNFKYMRAFADAFPFFPNLDQDPIKDANNQRFEFVQAELAQLTWYHLITLLDKVKDTAVRKFYIRKAIENGWSRDVMVHHIERGLHKIQGNLSTNFSRTIAPRDSELIQQMFKDPYCFDFLQLDEKARERDLEKALLYHIQKVLLELGQGFAFVGSQIKLDVNGQEFFLDLLFYHTKLRRYIVIELKTGEFVPEFIGKMNFYLGLVDERLNGEYDQSAIGIILCKQKNRFVAEYALRDIGKPIGIAEYLISEMLPEKFRNDLPTIAELENRLEKELKQSADERGTRSLKPRTRKT